MAASRRALILARQLKEADRQDDPNLLAATDDEDLGVWYFLAANLPDPYADGEYLFKLEAPEGFPARPPKFSFLTPNGVYDLGGAICISIGEFHATTAPGETGAYGWRPALGMVGFARQVVNGMVVPESLGGGIRILGRTPPGRVRALAADSQGYNEKHHPKILELIRAREEAAPRGQAASLRRMWRAARAARALPRLETGDLPAAFGPEAWGEAGEALERAAPRGRLPPPLEAQARELLDERDLGVRKALALTLRATLEAAEGAPEKLGATAPRLAEALRPFCGRAPDLPPALEAFLQGPRAGQFQSADLREFLRAKSPAAKAEAGARLNCFVRKGGEGRQPPPPPGPDDFDGLIDSLCDGLRCG